LITFAKDKDREEHEGGKGEIMAFQENRLRFEAFSPGVNRLVLYLEDANSYMESLKNKEKCVIETCQVRIF
jgi:hypothetical protein